MKQKLFFTLIISIFISACTTVQFETSVPKETALLPEFPIDLLGTYTNKDKDTLKITKSGFSFGGKESTLLQIKESLKPNKTELKRIANYYILNLREDVIWDVIPFTYIKDELSIYYIGYEDQDEKEVIEKIKQHVQVTEIKNKEGETTKYMVDPTNEELAKMLEENVFIKISVFKKIK